MADKSKIQWTEATWNPVIGCERVSEGCRHCYAETQAKRIALMHPGSAYGDVLRVRDGKFLPMWNGKAVTMPDRLDQPLRWARPRLIFVNSMSDLFHKDVPFEYIAACFGVMGAATQHTFQLLTKRPLRMIEFWAWLQAEARNANLSEASLCFFAARKLVGLRSRMKLVRYGYSFPFPNVHVGVSAEAQPEVEARVPVLLQFPASVHWVSAEPLLGEISLAPWLLPTSKFEAELHASIKRGSISGEEACNAIRQFHGRRGAVPAEASLKWVVVGGESGRDARACDINAVRSVVEQCRVTDVPVHVKQLGAVSVDLQLGDVIGPDGSVHYTRTMEGAEQMLKESERFDVDSGETVPAMGYSVAPHRIRLRHQKGGDIEEWPEDLRVRQYPPKLVGWPLRPEGT